MLLFSTTCAAESPSLFQKGRWGLAFQGAGGSGVSGSTKNTDVVWTGFRYKRMLTDVTGNGFFRGNLEYGVEFIPVFIIFQEDTVYGVDVSPFLMRWNFVGNRSMFVPFFEVGGGMLFTGNEVPARTARFNFTPQGGFGLTIFNSPQNALTFQLKYMHISNGGFQKPNPGINSIQFLAGYEWLR